MGPSRVETETETRVVGTAVREKMDGERENEMDSSTFGFPRKRRKGSVKALEESRRR